MAFYGRVTNESKTSMTFDRVYPNRAIMDASAKNDGVFSGRFVLVEYSTPIREAKDEYYFSVYEDKDKRTDIQVSDATGSFIFYKLAQNSANELIGEKSTCNVLTKKIPASEEDNQNLATLGDVFKVAVCDEEAWENLFSDLNEQDEAEPSLILKKYNEWYDANISDSDIHYFMVVPSMEDPHKEKGDYAFKDITSFIDAENEAQNYEINYNIDKNIYNASGTFGRGYDSTVWRKVIANDGTAKYVMLAELNSVVPTFDIAVDAPTNEPIAPHFGQDASNVYYPLHIQGNWGFRIAEARPDKLKTADTDRNDPSDISTQYPINNYDGSVWTETESPEYNGAIYFNKNGFNPDRSNRSDMKLEDNEITITPTGYSQKKYETHDVNHSVEERPDIQELRIILPALGDAVNDLYDTVAGEGQRQWETRWADPNAQIDRTRDSSLRLIYDGPDKGELDFDGAKGLTGTINAVHDILGMIITKEGKPKDANLAYADQIYYEQDEKGKNHYFCTVPLIEYSDENLKQEDYNLTPEGFAAKHPDKPKLIENLQAYGGNQFIKTNNTPTYELSKKDVGVPGAIYYTIPAQLQFAGNMVTSRDEKDYYKQDTDENGNFSYSVDSEGTYDIAKNDNGKEMYRILPDTEFYNENTSYYTYSEITHKFTPATVNSDNFDNKVAIGLYAEGKTQKQIISRTNTLYQVKYIDSDGNEKAQKLSGLMLRITNAPTENYTNHLDSIVSFKNFIKQAMQQQLGVDNDKIDYDWLYIESDVIVPDPDPDDPGNERQKYKKDYISTPVNKILFGTIDNITGTYDNWYTRTDTTVDGKQIYKYTKINANEWNTEGKKDYEPCYRIMPIQITPYEDDKYWRITVTADEEEELRDKRERNELETINTSDYAISKIVKSRTGFVENAIYWSIPEGVSDEFPQVGYGINEIASKKMEEDSDIAKYYTPNTLYYHDDKNDRYLLADDTYEFDPNESELYRSNELFIKNTGNLENELKLYSRWNNNLITSTDDIAYYFKPIEEGGHGVILGRKTISAEWKELDGFARDLNTIHGWIIKLNRLLNTDDIRTRDLNTIQGCINTLNDIIEKFNDLMPGELLGVDKFGRIASVDFNTEDEDGSWISMDTSIDDETGKTTLKVVHGDPHEVAERTVSDLTPNFGDTFTIEDWRFDEKGHKAGLQTHTVSIPKGSLAQTESKNVVTSIAFTDTTGAIDVTRIDLKDIPLTSVTEGTLISIPEINNNSTLGQALESITNYYNAGAINITLNNYQYTYTNTDSELSEPISNGDNLNDAFKKLQWQIDNHKENQLHVSETASVGNVISALTVSDGEITLSKANIGNLDLADYALGTDGSALTSADTINQALSKLQVQINNITGGSGAVNSFTSTGSGNNVAGLTLSGGVLSATLNNLTEVDLAGFTQGADTSAITASDSLGTALSKLQANITVMQGDGYVFSSVENNYSRIFRQETAPTGQLKSGWIWIQTSTKYVYFYTGDTWELLNSWQ